MIQLSDCVEYSKVALLKPQSSFFDSSTQINSTSLIHPIPPTHRETSPLPTHFPSTPTPISVDTASRDGDDKPTRGLSRARAHLRLNKSPLRPSSVRRQRPRATSRLTNERRPRGPPAAAARP